MNATCPHCLVEIEIDPATHAALAGQSHFACPSCQGEVPVPAPVRLQISLAPGARAATTPQRSHKPSKTGSASRKSNHNLLILGTTALLVLGGIAFFLASRKSTKTSTSAQNIRNEIIHNSYFQNLIAAGATTERELEAMAFIRRFESGFIGISREKLTWDQATKLAQQTGAEIPGIDNDSNPSGPAIVKWINTEVPSEIRPTLWVRRDSQPCVLDGHDVLNAPATDSPRKAAFLWRQEPGNAKSGSGPWIDLFTGQDVSHWRGDNLESFPSAAWTIENGTLRNIPDHYENLVTREQFRNFELEFEWKLSPGGNSGLIYGSQVFSREFSLIDDAGNPEGRFPKKSAGALCHVIAPADTKRLNPAGEFNQGRLIVNGNHVEHWINGTKLVEYELGSAELRSLADQSAFKQVADFTEPGPVSIRFQPGNGLQPSARNVWLRNIRIRNLDGAQTPTNTRIKQQIDLLALTDPVKDRIAAINGNSHSRGNNWKRVNGTLVYNHDGGSGKIASPVVISSRSYEMEVEYERMTGVGRLHVDIPLSATNHGTTIIPIYLDAPGFQMVSMKTGGKWPAIREPRGRAVIRLDRDEKGDFGQIKVTVDGEEMVNWKGVLTSVTYSVNETHPEFPGNPVPSLYAHEDSYKIKSWTLRIFDGEAKVLRQASASSSQ